MDDRHPKDGEHLPLFASQHRNLIFSTVDFVPALGVFPSLSCHSCSPCSRLAPCLEGKLPAKYRMSCCIRDSIVHSFPLLVQNTRDTPKIRKHYPLPYRNNTSTSPYAAVYLKKARWPACKYLIDSILNS